MKIYTRTGDEGETSLFGGGRVRKDDPRVRAYGAVDELNACLGRAILDLRSSGASARLSAIQHDLFALGAHLATPPAREGKKLPDLPPLPEARIAQMERWIDQLQETLPALTGFILPGGSAGAADLHVGRTVCRRAEREIVVLPLEGDAASAFAVRYLNRLSDLLFVMARAENLAAGVADAKWVKETREDAGG